MAHDPELALRIRELLGEVQGLSERRMFGGHAFLIEGNLAVSASGQGGMLVRCDPTKTDRLLGEEHAERFQMRGRAMDGWLRIADDGLRSKRQLHKWVRLGQAYAEKLPPKRVRSK